MTSAIRIKIAAVVILGVMILYWLYASLAAIIGGNSAALTILLQVILVGILAVVCWKWPLAGGIGMVLLAAGLAMYYLLVYYSLEQIAQPLMFLCVPTAVGGLLFVEADWITKKSGQKT